MKTQISILAVVVACLIPTHSRASLEVPSYLMCKVDGAETLDALGKTEIEQYLEKFIYINLKPHLDHLSISSLSTGASRPLLLVPFTVSWLDPEKPGSTSLTKKNVSGQPFICASQNNSTPSSIKVVQTCEGSLPVKGGSVTRIEQRLSVNMKSGAIEGSSEVNLQQFNPILKREVTARHNSEFTGSCDRETIRQENKTAGTEMPTSESQITYAEQVRNCISPHVNFVIPYRTEATNPTVRFRVWLNKDGTVSAAQMLKTSQDSQFDRAVEEGIKKCSPLPAPFTKRFPTYLDINYSMYY